MLQISERVFVETTYQGGNVGCVLTEQGPILVDTPMLPQEVRDWRKKIAELTSLPVLYIITTDCREECILGNALFEATVVAHELTWERLAVHGDLFWQQALNALRAVNAEAAAELEQWGLAYPQITFTERMVFYKGSLEIRLIHLGGRTPAAIAVYLPDEQIVFAGENMVINTLPVFAQADTKQWLQALTAIRKMRVQALVPGRGPVCDVEATQQLSEYIRSVREQVRRHFLAGRSKSELSGLIAELVDTYPVSQAEREGLRPRIKANLDRIFDEAKAQQRQK